jgi:hypothetical protein
MHDLSQETLKEWLHYNNETGVFTRKKSISNVRVGDEAGTYSHGYCKIQLFGREYQAHRLAWFYIYGIWPRGLIDHINRDKCDNRIANLRLATRQQNSFNQSAHGDNQLGVKGVHNNGYGYKAQIHLNGVQYCLGTFDTIEEATRVRQVAEARLFGEFAPNPDCS